MKIYLINLKRRPDRLANMQAQATALGASMIRINAVDARTASPSPGCFEAGPLGDVPRGDQCCTLSHVQVWREFLAGGDSHAAVLEDDVVLSGGAKFALGGSGWIPRGIDLVKLEHYGPPGQAVLLSDFTDVGGGLRVARMHSRHTGTGGYIISRRAAVRLLALTRFNLPVDHLLFNPNNSPLFEALRPWQLLPVVMRQQDFVGEKSDITVWRQGMPKLSLAFARRELVRFGYDLRLLPRQIALLATGQVQFVRIANPGRPALRHRHHAGGLSGMAASGLDTLA